ncbi:MAG TPA: ATP-binding cassette domain-containing protein [Candidatus Nanopelagicaceae bacterium]|nr:ATP-binding cassette domain-containing protein [Candidatus Nanopelagicaceae bacterium]
MSESRESSVAVNLIGLAKSFGPVTALAGLSIDVAAGELVALLGPSGCGKTTALRALAGLQDLDRGQILVNGRDVTNLNTNKRDMGMVFQAYSLFPHMTALENVEYGLRMRAHRTPAAQRRSRSSELLDLVGLASHANHFPHQMSGGQQQRIALARALAISPTVLLLDEPLSALDAKVRTQLRDEIRRIQLEVGTTTLFVTHDQEEALGVADRVGVMKMGVLEQIASPSELYERPRTAFVAEFVGLTNQLPGTVRDGMIELMGTKVPTLPGSIGSGAGIALVRPESILVEPSESGNARVITASFLGAIARVHLQTKDGASIIAQIPSSDAAEIGAGRNVTISLMSQPVFAKPA